jgi:hypothetical protein
MDRTTFQNHLLAVTELVLERTPELVFNALPREARYLLFAGNTGEQALLQNDEPADGGTLHFSRSDRFRDRAWGGPKGVAEVVSFLWRDGQVPAWVNVYAYAADAYTTYLKVVWSGDFTDDDSHLYYRDWTEPPTPPFVGGGPPLPLGWRSIEQSGKFDLNWHHRLFE